MGVRAWEQWRLKGVRACACAWACVRGSSRGSRVCVRVRVHGRVCVGAAEAHGCACVCMGMCAWEQWRLMGVRACACAWACVHGHVCVGAAEAHGCACVCMGMCAWEQRRLKGVRVRVHGHVCVCPPVPRRPDAAGHGPELPPTALMRGKAS